MTTSSSLIMRRRTRISVTVELDGGSITLADACPLVLSGSRRLWRKQIEEALARQCDAVVAAVAQRVGSGG